ncbi:MAG: type II secretion system F family protein [Planctomycetaceae bacterium]
MPDFQYLARELGGRQVGGLLTATSEQEALGTLAARSLFPVRLELAEAAKSQQRRAGRGVRPRFVSVFYTQLADLLRSGVPLLRSLELLERKTSHQTLKLVIQNIREQVADGTHLAEAMRAHPRVFGELAVSMVRAGEEGSFLEDVLKRIAAFTDHQESLKSRVLGAMIYPMFLLGAGLIVVVLMLTIFVPKFTPMFARLAEQGALPWATTALISVSDGVKHYWVLAALLIGVATIGVARAFQSAQGRMWLDRARIRAYGMGPIVRSLAIARFCRILGTLLQNGVPILHALRIAKDATGNRVLSQAIASAAESVSTGESLAVPLGQSGEFSEDIVEMISVGEEANNLEEVLVNIAENMERLTNRRLELFVRMLEPAMLTVMAGIILFVVVALMLPILQSSRAF